MRKISAWRIDHMMGKDYLHRGLWDARRSRDTCLVVKIPRRRSRRDTFLTEHRSNRQSRGKASPAEK
jgi:hypothetical protein